RCLAVPMPDASLAGTPVVPAASLLAAVRAAAERLQRAAGLPALARAAAAEVRRLTGYDRVLLVEAGRDGVPRLLADDRRDGLPPADAPLPPPPPRLVVAEANAPDADWLRACGARAGFLLPLAQGDRAWGYFA